MAYLVWDTQLIKNCDDDITNLELYLKNPKYGICFKIKNKEDFLYNDLNVEFILDEEKNFVLDENGNKIKNPSFNQNMGLFIPKDYPGKEIFEDLYEWVKEKQKEYREQQQNQQGKEQQNQQGNGQSQKQDQKGSKSNQKGKGNSQSKGEGDSQDKGDKDGNGTGDKQDQKKSGYGKNGKNDVECQSMDQILKGIEQGKQMTLDSHLDDDVPPEAKKSMIDDFTNRLKNRGLVSDEVEKVLRKLKKSKKNYLKLIKRTMTNHVFGSSKHKSITKPNRRGIEGIKGRKKYKNCINCLLDTSGSMCGDFEKVLSYIFQNDISINLIQCDTEIKKTLEIKSKKDLNKMIIKGLGGTTMQPGINYIADKNNGLSNYSTILLTDGFTDSLDLSNLKTKILILSTSQNCPISKSNGKLKQIIIDRENSIYDKP